MTEKFREGRRVTYHEGSPNEGYSGVFLRYEEDAETGGDCVVRWEQIDGRWLPQPVEAREYAAGLVVETVTADRGRREVYARRPVTPYPPYTTGLVEVARLLGQDGYARLWALTDAGVWVPLNSSGHLWRPDAPEPVEFYASKKTLVPQPGLFFYSGLGMGNLFLPDGTVRWMTTTEAQEAAARWGVQYRFVDSFKDYVPIALGDR